MLHGLIDPKGQMHTLSVYEIEGLCKAMLETAIKNDENYRKAYEEKYQGKINYFSEALEFCIHELGWMLYDPFCTGKNDVLFSNGKRAYITSSERIKDPTFDPKSITREDIGFGILTDEEVGFDRTLTNIDTYDDGIINEKGFVSTRFVRGDLNALAQVILMHELIRSQTLYEHYMKNRGMYTSHLDYLTSFANTIAVDKLDSGKFSLRFVSDNDGKVQDFINALTMSGMIEDLDPMVVPEAAAPMVPPEAGIPMVIEEEQVEIPMHK